MHDSAVVPTLGVTAVLALLWVVAVLLAGPGAPAAIALDPGLAGSLSDLWGIALLAVALLVAAYLPAAGSLALAPAALLLGEAGQAHAWAAGEIAQMLGLPSSAAWIKIALAVILGSAALLPAFRFRGPNGVLTLILLCSLCGVAAVVLESAQIFATIENRWWLIAGEEWAELTVQSFLSSWVLVTATDRSRVGTRDRTENDARRPA